LAKRTKIEVIGVPWFTAETWPRLLEVVNSTEADKLPDTYSEWIALAGPRFAQHIADGLPVERVLIDPDEWVDWCELNDLPVDGATRAAFAAFVLARRAGAH
jgi:hypothetical protein